MRRLLYFLIIFSLAGCSNSLTQEETQLDTAAADAYMKKQLKDQQDALVERLVIVARTYDELRQIPTYVLEGQHITNTLPKRRDLQDSLMQRITGIDAIIEQIRTTQSFTDLRPFAKLVDQQEGNMRKFRTYADSININVKYEIQQED